MFRYFLRLSYEGTAYSGWQIQPSAKSVQQTIEIALSKYLKQKISIVGCGRTDTGVHARSYYAHFEINKESLSDKFLFHINHVLPSDIAIHEVFKVDPETHARYSANERLYRYYIRTDKSAFNNKFIYQYHLTERFDFEKLHDSARLLSDYGDFFTFCKSNSGVKSTECELHHAKWIISPDTPFRMTFEIKANRFLRGMVRLVVGMSLNVAEGKLSLREVKSSLESKQRLQRDWSVPAHGLFLEEIAYPFLHS